MTTATNIPMAEMADFFGGPSPEGRLASALFGDRAYGTSTIKRTRRTKNDMEDLRRQILTVAGESKPTTARFIFYRCAALGVVAKTAAGYRTVQREVSLLRERGDMPFAWIADNTRWVRKPHTHDDLQAFLDEAARVYRRDLWSRSLDYVEIWCESDSVAGVLMAVTSEFDVPLMVLRGYSSSTFAYNAAKHIEADGRPAFLYYFGDHDPSGVDIERSLQESLHRYAPKADITFERVAVTAEDIEEMDLPGSIKKTTDTRSKNFNGQAVEVESVPVEILRRWCREVIEQHVDHHQLSVLRVAEASERSVLLRLADEVAS